MSESNIPRPQRDETPKKPQQTGLRLVIPFLAVLAILTVVSFIIPLRPTISQREKRPLATFPEFSWAALAEGSYFDDITTWYADTFPGRESWLDLSSGITSLHGHSEISIAGDLPIMVQAQPEAEPETDFTIPLWTNPPETLPQETVPDTTVPETTAETEAAWGGVDAGNEAEIDMAGDAIVQIGDSAFNCVGFSQGMSDKYAKSLNMLADRMAPLGKRVISAPAPTAIGIMVEQKYLEMLGSVDQGQTIEYFHSQMNDNVVKVDTHNALLQHNDEYVYFRTDHHWTALGAYYTYEAICNSLGYEPLPLSEFREWDQGEMEGSLYWRVNNPKKLKMDNIMTYVPPYDIDVVIHTQQGSVRDGELVQDCSDWEINAKYSAFICSDNPITIITNNDLPDAPSAILVKDSFGNALAPFLAATYHKVYVIDYRKYDGKMGTMGWLAQSQNIDDIIFGPYVIGTQATDGNIMFRNLCS